MQFIVTGGAGFIGSQVVWELARRHPDAVITVVDDFTSASFRNLSGFNGDVLAYSCVQVDWKQHFGKRNITCIYHLASITDTTVADQREMISRNVEGFRRVLRFSTSRGIPVVYASSAATYGLASGSMREKQTPAPANVYGFSKMVLDNIARDAVKDGMLVVGVRYFNVYGPHEAHKGKMASMIYQLYQQMKAGQRPRVFKNGEQQRDFVYIKDAVQGTLLAGQCEEAGVYNIGSGTAVSFNAVIAQLNTALGTDYEPEYIDNPYSDFFQQHTEADLTLSRKELGYDPQWPAADGIRDYVAWLEASGSTAASST